MAVTPTGVRVRSALRTRADAIRLAHCKNLVVVLEDPEDVRNVGTVIRNVNALGAEKVYVVDERSSLPENWQEMREHPKLNRPSASAVKWSFVKTFPDTQACLSHLQRSRFASVATSPHRREFRCVSLAEGDYPEFTKSAVWFGNENHGISDLAVEHCAYCINVPMFGLIETLNLATSSGIVLYEITKQRRAFQNRLHAKVQEKKRATAA